MRFVLTEEQQMIESSVLAFLDSEHSFQQRGARLHSANDDAGLWRRFAEMGWLGLPMAEEAGGLGGGALAVGLLMRAFGRHLVVESYLALIALGGRLVAELGTAPQKSRYLPSIIDGSMKITLAHDELGVESPWTRRRTRAMRHADGWRLHGRKALVAGVPGAALLLVSATAETQDGRALGQRVFMLAPDAAGIQLHECMLSDNVRAADVELADVHVGFDALLGGDRDVAVDLARLHAEAVVAMCWEASGVMSAAFEQTTAYTQQRSQFGQPLSHFQVVQHRLAEMAVHCEEARAACELAALRIERGDADALALASMAKSKVGRGARFVAQEAVQLHGAMGVCEELPIAASFRKLTAFCQQAGSTSWHSHHLGCASLAGDDWKESQTLPKVGGPSQMARPDREVTCP